MADRESNYKSVYSEYLLVTAIGVLVLVCYKLTLHSIYINKSSFFCITIQDTKALKNFEGSPWYYFWVLVSVFLLPVIIYFVERFELERGRVKTWWVYSCDRNWWPNCMAFIGKGSSVLSQVFYGITFCFISDSIEVASELTMGLIVLSNTAAVLFVLIRSVNSRKYVVSVPFVPDEK
ncbi:hypothetical protein ACNY67_06665 [Pantoea sp. KXB45]|uniref:hypothetical protein n=1 Tax=Pantoea sp. KXB45 TaxID=3402309 RepID=UPI003AB46D71